MRYFLSEGSAQEFAGAARRARRRRDLSSTCLKPEALAARAHLPRVFQLSAPVVLGWVGTRKQSTYQTGDPFTSCFKLNLHVHVHRSKRLMADKLTPAALSYKLPATCDNL